VEDVIVVMVTVPSADKGAEIGRALVAERLCACVNVLPGLRSIYRWEGQVTEDAEALCLIKTRRSLFEPLRDRVLALHPYSVPEIVALDITQGSAPYLRWIVDATQA